MRTVYIANDGTEFNDAESCENYEYDLIKATTKAKWYDEFFVSCFPDEAIYVLLPDNKAMEDFKFLCEKERASYPKTYGLWRWSTEDNDYIPIVEYERKVKNELENLKKIKEEYIYLKAWCDG